MKPIKKHFLTCLLVIVAGAGLCSCVGYVGAGDAGYYHHGWYDDGPWLGGPRGYVGVGIHAYRR